MGWAKEGRKKGKGKGGNTPDQCGPDPSRPILQIRFITVICVMYVILGSETGVCWKSEFLGKIWEGSKLLHIQRFVLAYYVLAFLQLCLGHGCRAIRFLASNFGLCMGTLSLHCDRCAFCGGPLPAGFRVSTNRNKAPKEVELGLWCGTLLLLSSVWIWLLVNEIGRSCGNVCAQGWNRGSD